MKKNNAHRSTRMAIGIPKYRENNAMTLMKGSEGAAGQTKIANQQIQLTIPILEKYFFSCQFQESK